MYDRRANQTDTQLERPVEVLILIRSSKRAINHTGFCDTVGFLLLKYCTQCEPDGSVSIVSGYGLDDQAIEVRSPAEARGFFL
jgi:hypothetical protein